ncbi:cysteine-rich repeat secretory protein 38-like [Zingiber officinale]|uniref:cysteine-rich repeat secretory protein 38-like n=1 Tax=Zingiber officinale TaxID=94328 RepID=UPI001C4C466C|nr:cysteine-rich repeat secretory protein 38-like [Zingiber officinale]
MDINYEGWYRCIRSKQNLQTTQQTVNFTPISIFSTTTTTAAAGFYNDTIGRPPNQVYGLALCQGDLSLGACQGCLNASVTLITDRCPTGMNSTVWYNHCMLRYSNENFFSTVDIIPYVVYVKNLAMHNASDPRILIFQLGNLMNRL